MAGLDLNRMKSLTKKALYETSGAVNGSPKAPDLRLYETLNDDDFEAIRTKYGEDQVTQYVKEMEAKRLGVN